METGATAGKAGKAEVKSFRDLDVWVKSTDLAAEIGRLAKKLPKYEQFELAGQIRSAADSISSNIAEGHGRTSRKEFVHFLHIANGSNCEVQTQITLCVKKGYWSKEDTKKALALTYDIGRMLKKLIKVLTESEQL